jgi:Holliday junction DNA helicase RuvA
MIGRLRGVLVARTATGVVIEVGGVGYELVVTPRDQVSLPMLGEEVVLHTHLVVREDLLALYGFEGEQSRDMFRVLLGSSGVGPALAHSILATLRPDEVRMAVATEDVQALVAVHGIGKRTAEKLILELRPKLGALSTRSAASGSLARVREALESLGYAPAEIREALQDIPVDGPVEELVRSALRVLARR